MMNAQTGIVNIRGKEYQTVALRVQKFREEHPDYALLTSVIDRTNESVVMLAQIADATGRILATGHSEEYRASSQINKTSALENAETSAIGRALAAFGLGGTEFATANEVVNAIHQQAAGGQSDGTVSPQQPPKTHLDAAEKRMVRELESCEDEATLVAYLKTTEAKADYKMLSDHREWAIHGPAPEDLDGFIPIAERIKLKRDAFRITDLART